MIIDLLDLFNVEALKKDIKVAWKDLILDGETDMRVNTLVSGASGKYLPLEVCKLLSIDSKYCSDPDSEGYYDEWETVQHHMNNTLNTFAVRFKLDGLSPFRCGSLRFYTEDDGDFVIGITAPEDIWDKWYVCAESGDLFEEKKDPSHTFLGKKYCYEVYREKVLAYFEDKWADGGSFMSNLCDLCTKSDMENLGKLYLGFPEIVDGYCVYGLGRLYKDKR